MTKPTPIIAGSYRQLESGDVVLDTELTSLEKVEESIEPKAEPKAPTPKKR